MLLIWLYTAGPVHASQGYQVGRNWSQASIDRQQVGTVIFNALGRFAGHLHGEWRFMNSVIEPISDTSRYEGEMEI